MAKMTCNELTKQLKWKHKFNSRKTKYQEYYPDEIGKVKFVLYYKLNCIILVMFIFIKIAILSYC